ncbi:MAG: hypothetical protein AAFR38_01400 [Planctomycetota bacterium]
MKSAILKCAAAVIALVWLGGCAGGKILRENVLATTQSTIGVTIAQNAQTQVYELKAGFARNEFFLVPTNKTIQYAEKGGAKQKESAVFEGSAAETANVLAEIQVGGASKGSNNSVEIYQRLAVGDIAVRSGAAIALYSQNEEVARAIGERAVSLGEGSSPAKPEAIITLLTEANELLTQPGSSWSGTARVTSLQRRIDAIGDSLDRVIDFIEYEPGGVGTGAPDFRIKRSTALGQSGFGRLTEYVDALDLSITNAQAMKARVDARDATVGTKPTVSLRDNRPATAINVADVPSDYAVTLQSNIESLERRRRELYERLSQNTAVQDLVAWYLEILGIE